MKNIKDLIKTLKSDEFFDATKEAYYFLTLDRKEPKVSLEEYASAIRGLFVDAYITAANEEEMNYIMQSAISCDIYAVNANDMFKTCEASKSKPGDIVEIDYFKQRINITEYQDESMYDDLSKYDSIISKIIKKEHCFYSIKQIKRGDYVGPQNYRISQKEIRTIENVKLIKPLNKLIHDLYDVTGTFFDYCEYDDIPEDSILKKFAFHTGKNNPLFKIVFEDGTIVEYLEGDLRVLSYKYQDLLELTKLHMIQELQQNYIYDIDSLAKKDFVIVVEVASNMSKGVLNTLEDVYTKRMIDSSKRELNSIKELVKEYDL